MTSKDIYAAKVWAAGIYAAGIWRGLGVAVVWVEPTNCAITAAVTMPANAITAAVIMPANTVSGDVKIGCGFQD